MTVRIKWREYFHPSSSSFTSFLVCVCENEIYSFLLFFFFVDYVVGWHGWLGV
jgi:hypothetical protein